MEALETKNQDLATLAKFSQVVSHFTQSSEKLEERYELLRKEVEALKLEVKKKDEEIKGARKLAVLGEAAAQLAHEIRNPLGAMSLFVSLLRQDLEGNTGALSLVDEMSKSITALNAVVSNTLHFAKDNKKGVMTPFNLHSVIQEVSAHFETLLAYPGKITLSLDANPFVRGDSGELRQVIYNLLTNAAQATEYRGSLSITSSDQKDRVLITVKDNGPGIKEEMLSTLFEPFATDKQLGTGLGLAIVKNIITKHGGSISVANDNGAVFEIELPRTRKSNVVGEAK